jgi:hypothetical protein
MDDASLDTDPNLAYAVRMVHATCGLAGSASYLADLREDLRANGIIRAVRDRDTPALFDWLIRTLSFQGISDTVAAGYIADHGSVRWSEIADALSARPSCPKLNGYWRFGSPGDEIAPAFLIMASVAVTFMTLFCGSVKLITRKDAAGRAMPGLLVT